VLAFLYLVPVVPTCQVPFFAEMRVTLLTKTFTFTFALFCFHFFLESDRAISSSEQLVQLERVT